MTTQRIGASLAITLAACFLLGLPAATRAQAPQPTGGGSLKALITATGPAHVTIGNANLDVPDGCSFIDQAHAARFKELTQNLSHNELGIVIPSTLKKGEDFWWTEFRFQDVGYVKDNETLNNKTIDSIYSSIQKGTEKANSERVARGWDTLSAAGWSQRPFYDPATHALTWGLNIKSPKDTSVNYEARVLGRRGVMEVTLVLGGENVQNTVPIFQKIVKGVTFNPGETYAEFRPGDKIAQYGLVGLITGGAAVVAFKLWKPLLAFGAVIVGGIGTMFRKIKNALTGRR